MPHSLYATDTDLTADNLLRLPAGIWLSSLGL
ncbi:diaminopimelate decarboxylase [Klebsiella variicola]|nr:diaminopimelate decarboxylase [Klebsiella variicola]